MSMLKGAIIGFGFIAAEGHLVALKQRQDLEIVAIFDQNPDRRAVAELLLPRARFYTSIDKLFECETLDFVDIATSPASHIDYIRTAISKKLHVLCEKPLVLREDHLADISNYINSGSKTVYTVHNWKFAPIFLKTSELIQSGQIGSIKHVRYEVLRTGPSVAVSSGNNNVNWRLRPEIAGGGILVDHGWHAFYNVCGWIGKLPVRVKSLLENRKFKDLDVEDTATVTIGFDGAEAEVFFTWAAEERKNQVIITGTQGELRILDDVIHCVNGSGEKKIPFEEALSKGSHHPEWYTYIVADFVRSMSDRDFRGNNFNEAAISLMLTAGAQRSHRNGGENVAVDLGFLKAGDIQ